MKENQKERELKKAHEAELEAARVQFEQQERRRNRQFETP